MFRSLALVLALSLGALAEDKPNTLKPEEQSAGWRLLFDGTSTKGWHAIGKIEAPTGWSAQDGELRLSYAVKGVSHGDIITEEQFGDFDLVWEWKIAPNGNSGVKYNLPDPNKNVGCEYQLLDDEGHPDGKLHDGTRTTASLYDVIAPAANKKYHPPGEWNQSRIVVKGDHVVHYLNGEKTVEFDFGSDTLKELIAKSKFKSTPGWGLKTRSPLLLQDHGNEIAFRNIKVLAPQK